jgi:hypothetical protein
VAEKGALLRDFLVDDFGESVVVLEKLFEDLIRVVGKAVTALELTFSKEAFSEFFPAVLVIKSAFDGVAEYFISL